MVKCNYKENFPDDNDIRKLCNIQQARFEAAESLRKTTKCSNPYEDIDTGLEWNMIKVPPRKAAPGICFLRQNAELIKRSNVGTI